MTPSGPAVVVDPYSSGALLAPAFADAGVPVVAVVTAPEPPAVYASSYRPGDFAEILVHDGGDVEPIVRRLRELGPRCVLAGCESGVELTDAIAPLVTPDVANEPALAAARRHKGEMAAAVEKAGLPVIAQLCTDDPDEVRAWIGRSGLAGRDLVIKPPKSASTDGVTRVAADAWRPVFDAMLGSANRLGIVNDRLVVQEHVTGVEYVVDTFSADGRHTVTDVCRYRKVDNGGHMAVYDSMEWLPPGHEAVDELVEYACGVLDAVGLRTGAAHVEIMRTADGPRLIEVGARAHGGGHPRFCRIATGDSQVDRTVRHFAGLGGIPDRYELRTAVLVVFLINTKAGVVRDASGFAAVPDLPGHAFSAIHVADGQRLEVTKDLFASLDLGFVVLAHDDPRQVWADYDAIRAIERSLVLD